MSVLQSRTWREQPDTVSTEAIQFDNLPVGALDTLLSEQTEAVVDIPVYDVDEQDLEDEFKCHAESTTVTLNIDAMLQALKSHENKRTYKADGVQRKIST
jgi:hypothetical protein